MFLGAWNDYLVSLIMINNRRPFTMQLSVAQFLNTYGAYDMPRYAAPALIFATPTAALRRGTLAGAIRG
jgi:ABC-type glycerol-3-phosphate transport system permease component